MSKLSTDITPKIVSKEEFQKDKFYFSYSSLVKLMRDPPLFHNDYILRQKEDLSAKHLSIGELLHCLVLEPENFDEKFVVMSKRVPGGKLKDAIDNVYNTYTKPLLESNPGIPYTLEDFSKELLMEFIEIDLYQKFVDAKKAVNGVMLSADDKRLEKTKTIECTEYFSTLIEGEKKTVVDLSMVEQAKGKATAIFNSKVSMDLLTGTSIKNDVRKEIELKADIPNYPFGLKGIIDCVKVDYAAETIYITDLKTTSLSLEAWKEKFEISEYMYWLQAIVYKELVLSLVPKDNDGTWKLKVHYLVVDKNNKVYPFPVSATSLASWEFKTKEVLDKANWHFTNHVYDLPYEYEQGLVEL